MRKIPVSASIPKPLSLRKNLSWTFLGYAVYVLCQWGMLIVLAKLVSPEQVGQFALGFAVTAPVVLFANLGLRPYQATDAERRYAFPHYLGLRLSTTVLALLVIAGVALLAGYGQETALVILVIGLAKCLEAISDIFYGLLQQRERMDRISRSMMAKGILSLAALATGVYLTESVLWGAVGLAVVWAVILVVYDFPGGALVLGELPRPRWEARKLRELAMLSLPLGLAVVLTSLNANIPRYLIEHYLSERELGIFAAMAYPLAAGATVVGALGQSSSPRLARHYADGDRAAFRRLLLKLAGLGAALGAVGVLVASVAGRQILTLVYTPEYAEHLDVFLLLMVGAGITYVASFAGFGMIAARRLRAQVPLFVVVVGVTTLSCLLLTPRVGLLGAAVAVVLGAVTQLGGSVGVLARAVRGEETS